MNPDVQKKLEKTKHGPNKALLISSIVLLLIVLVLAGQITYMVYINDEISKGVYVNDIYAGGLTKSELTDLLNRSYQDKAAISAINLKIDEKNINESVRFDSIDVSYDIAYAVNSAYSVGREGNLIERLKRVLNVNDDKTVIELPYTFNKDKVMSILNSIYDKVYIAVKESELTMTNNKVTLKTGHHGEHIDVNDTMTKIENFIAKCEGGELQIPIIRTNPAPMDVDEYYSRIVRDAENARADVQNNQVVIIPEVIGRSIDKDQLAAIIAELQGTEDTERVLPVKFITPAILKQDAGNMVFRDVLSSYKTVFDTSTVNNANRAVNIRLATEAINGKILAPGEVFSYNDVVGPRTVERGYKEAHAYANGKIINDVGGGICQVSTTLFNAVFYAGLETVERINHMFTVGYVSPGADAAVSYGSADYKFKNTSNWPVKIVGEVTDNNELIFKLLGTDEREEDISIVMYTPVIETYDYAINYIDDPDLPEGTEITTSYGMKGYLVDTYKIEKKGDQVIKETKLFRSYYQPLAATVRRGTKKTESTESGVQNESAAATQVQSAPVDQV